MTNRIKKSFYFDPDSLSLLQKYQYENHLSSLSDAINEILLNSQEISSSKTNTTTINETAISKIVDEIGKRYYPMWSRTESHTKFSDLNLQIIMEILNTFAIELNHVNPDYFKNGIGSSYHKSNVISDSEFEVQRKLENLKEKKDNRK